MREVDANLGSPAYIADPYPTYRALRDEDPVFWSENWGVWILTRYDDVQTVLKDYASFSNADRFSAMSSVLPAASRIELQPLIDHNSVGMLQSDPPDHTRLRGLVRKVFSPRVIADIQPTVQSIVDAALDEAEAKGYVDVIADLAYQLPMKVICQLLGIPDTDSEQFILWADAVSAFQATGAPQARNSLGAARAIVEIEGYFDRVCHDRRKRPSDDLISIMLAAEDDGEVLTHSELINMCVNLLFAGHETTKSLIANAVVCLLRNEDQLVQLRSNPQLIDGVIEETLRYESPIQRGWRRVVRDTSFHGNEFRAGSIVFMMIGAANRDERKFAASDTFNILRTPNPHIAFGHGVHHCLGAPLARIEAPIAIGSLIGRFKSLCMTNDFTWMNNVHVRSPQELRLELG